MAVMDISARNEFAATPDRVAAMLLDPAYLERVCIESGALSHAVAVAGTTTTTTRSFPAPSQVAKFTNGTLTIVETIAWAAPGADGGRTGQLSLTVQGLPVTMNGSVRLAPGGKGSTVAYTGQFTIHIPFVGRKLEDQAAPLVTDQIATEQRVGDAWLARA